MSCCGVKACFAGIFNKGSNQPPKGNRPEANSPLLNVPRKSNVEKGGIDRARLINDNEGKKILDFFTIDKKKLGEGSYGSVSKAKNKATNSIVAVKTIAKAQMKNVERFKAEIAIMKMMDHPNIIKLYESFEDLRNVYLILELSSGGELFDKIIDAGHFTEVQAAILMQQMIKGINYMHQNQIAHRDLKPENFLFANKGSINDNMLKIIDFGLSCKFEKGQVLTTKAGTPYYVAPQVLAGKYNQLCDLWSAGVIMYVLLSGYPPFFGETDADVLSKVKLGSFSFPAADWKHISEDAKNLIRMLLKMNPADRYTAAQALNHEWVAKKAPKSKGVSLQSGFVDNLRSFRSQNKLKKAALQVIAQQFNDDQIKSLRDIFMALDANGDGLLNAQEMRTGLQKSGLKNLPSDFQQILEGIDADGSGVIDYTEFLAATLDKRSYMREDVCWAAFRVFDKNGDGQISMAELQAVIDDGDVQDAAGGAQTLAALMKDVDTDGNGTIDFDEFMKMMRGGR